MPDVIIKGMEMPKNCFLGDCPCLDHASGRCQADKDFRYVYGDRPYWCPLSPAPEWISVEERLPKPGARVLIVAGVFVGEGYLAGGSKWYRSLGVPICELTDRPVSHWMPLPELPEEQP